MKKSLAVIIPVYRSTETVKQLVTELADMWKNTCHYHIYLVDDGNETAVAEYLQKHCLQEHVTLIRLTENFGQQKAVFCGLQRVSGYDYVATMDDDLAHPAEALYSMYCKIEEGYDIVYGILEQGEDYSFGSRMRDVLFHSLLHCPKGNRVSSFRIMTGEVAREVSGQKGKFFYFSAAALKSPKRIANVTYRSMVDKYRSSGYNVWKRVKLFWNIVWQYVLPFADKKSTPRYEIEAVYPRLMVLGGSRCQLHALERAKKEDMYTVLADYTKSPVGAKWADVHEVVSTFDSRGCLEAAKKHKIQGVMTMGTDQPVLTAAGISEALSLPTCLDTSRALLVTNKKLMKQRMAEAGIPTVPWRLADETTEPEEFRGLKPPYVIKPLDSQGQRGIFKLDTPEEVLAHLPDTLAYSRCREALVEEYYESDEMTVSGYISNHKLIILTITDRLLYPDPVHIGVCIGHRFPSVHMDQYEKIREISESLVEAFDLPEGPFYLQLLCGDKGIVVNELACRIGGAFEDVMVPWLTGFDLLGAVMRNAMGHPVDTGGFENFRADKIEKAASVQLMFCEPGEIACMTPEQELRKLPFVLDCGYNYGEGSVIPKMENATARFGHAVITGTKENIGEHINAFYDALSVQSVQGQEMKLRLYPKE